MGSVTPSKLAQAERLNGELIPLGAEICIDDRVRSQAEYRLTPIERRALSI